MQNRSFLGSIPPVTLNLIIVNFIVWLAALTLPKIAGINLNYWLGLHYFAADDFNVVLRTIDVFLNSPFAAAVQLVEYSDCWSASSGKWSKNRGAEL